MSRPLPVENHSDPSSSPIVATMDQLDEDVSMTKITLHLEQAAVAPEVLDLDVRCTVDLQAVAPLHDHGPLARELFEAEVAQLRRVLDAVEVDMGELNSTGIDPHELKCRAGHRSVRTGALGNTADERRF